MNACPLMGHPVTQTPDGTVKALKTTDPPQVVIVTVAGRKFRVLSSTDFWIGRLVQTRKQQLPLQRRRRQRTKGQQGAALRETADGQGRIMAIPSRSGRNRS